METGTVGYVTDVPYSAGFSPDLAPAWLDFVARLNGFRPPDRDAGFAWCELGCGRGLSAVVFAASHPGGRFHAVDLMPGHVREAEATARAAGAGNLRLHEMDFAAAAELELPAFDYIVAHGVYAWIDDAAKAGLHRFLDRHLAPGGLVYLSYNALPGWTLDAPYQHLIRALAGHEDGDSIARFAAAAEAVQELTGAGAPARKASPMASGGWAEQRERMPRTYFAHEYLAPAWRPLYVDEVRAAMAGIGLEPVGSAFIRHNFDSYVLRAAARAALDAIEDPDLRELTRDYFLFARFRRDVFGRSPPALDDDARRHLLATAFALVRPPELVSYEMQTEAGTVGFDNPVTRALVAALAEGPRRLDACAAAPGNTRDLLANALALAAAQLIRPVETAALPGQALQSLTEALREPTADDPSRRLVPLPCGTALWTDARAIEGTTSDDPEEAKQLRAWAELLRSHGVQVAG